MISLIDYGAGNLASIRNAFKKLGEDVDIINDPSMVSGSSAIILPGVGSFGDAMEKLTGFRQPIKDAMDDGIPFLGLCLGIQVILEESMESPGVEGLGLLKGTCRKFLPGLKVPHMGWNNLEDIQDSPLLEGVTEEDFFYFVHSYYPMPSEDSIIAARTEYGLKFPSVISSGSVHATQFHPEKSAESGLKILKNFLALVK